MKTILVVFLSLGLQLPATGDAYSGRISVEDSDLPRTQFQVEIPQTQFQTDTPQVNFNLRARHTPSALGIRITPAGCILAVDPSCSVYGQVFPGDCMLTIGGIKAWTAYRNRSSQGEVGTPVDCTFCHPGGEPFHLTVIRHPMANFTPIIKSGLMPY